MKNIKIDVLIIGAGPSGSVAAAYLQNKDINFMVIEKNEFPRFAIGESLLPRCMDHFQEVGLIDCISEYGFEIKRGARFIKEDKICEFDFSKKHTKGYDWTWQVPRADFDLVITDKLKDKGVNIAFGHEVIDVLFKKDGTSTTTVKSKEGETYLIKSKYIIDSSGFGRVLPRLLDLDKPSEIPKHSSIFSHVKDINRPKGKEGTIITFDVISKNCWLWVIPFSNGNTSIGFVCENEFLDSFVGTSTEKLRKMLKLSKHYYKRFKHVDFQFEPISIKNYSKSVKQLFGKGFVLTGNSAEFLDPVFSSGVTFATESGLLGAKLIAKELCNEKVDWQKDYEDYILQGTAVFGSYVKEWYTGNLQTIFFVGQDNPKIKKQICAVLAGYVWDKTNPFVKNHNRLIATLANFIKLENK